MWKRIKLYRKQILALNWLMIIDLFCFRSTMSETECEYWQKGLRFLMEDVTRDFSRFLQQEQGQVDSMDHVAVWMREFLHYSSRNTQLPPSFHAERLLTGSFLPTIPV